MFSLFAPFLLLEELLSPTQDLVQGIVEEAGRGRHFFTYLIDEFLPTLLDFRSKRLLDVSLLHRLLPLFRLIDDHVRHERTGQSPCFRLGITLEEGVDRACLRWCLLK